MPDLLSGSVVRALDTPPTVVDRQGTAVTGITSTSYAAGSPVCGTAFTAPTTGRVLVTINAELDNSTAATTYCGFRIGEGASVGAGTEFQAPDDSLALFAVGTDNLRDGLSELVTGLTAGDTYNVQLMQRVSAGTGAVGRRAVTVAPAT